MTVELKRMILSQGLRGDRAMPVKPARVIAKPRRSIPVWVGGWDVN
jgi:hypothetical protein